MNGSKDKYVTTRFAIKTLGVRENTLRSWADKGLIPTLRTPGGQRLYALEKFINENPNYKDEEEKSGETNGEGRIKFCYCRVSSQGQKEDLERQISYMREKFPEHRIVSDIGSGINFRRKALRTILELSSKGMVEEVVVAYRDRLCRFAFELFEWIFHLHGVKLLVLDKRVEAESNQELAEDLLAIVNVFNCRVNGRRKYTKKEKGSEKEANKAEESFAELGEEV